MTQEKSAERAERGWSKLEKKAAGGVGRGFEGDPQKGTKNPFTSHLKPAEPTNNENQSTE